MPAVEPGILPGGKNTAPFERLKNARITGVWQGWFRAAGCRPPCQARRL